MASGVILLRKRQGVPPPPGNIIYYKKMIFEAMTTSAVMDVPTDEQELPEPVRLRAKCAVPGEASFPWSLQYL